MLKLFNALQQDQSGQDMAEYALLIALLALAVIVAIGLLGGSISSVLNNIGTQVDAAVIP